MEETKNNKQNSSQNCEGNGCFMCKGKTMCGGLGYGSCCGWHGGRHSFLRVILMIVILSIVFGFGVKLGELKGSFGDGYGGFGRHSYMMYPYNYGYGQSYPMMGWQGYTAPQSAQPQGSATK